MSIQMFGRSVTVSESSLCTTSVTIAKSAGTAVSTVKDIIDCASNGAAGENYCAKGVYAGLMSDGTYQQYLTSPAIYTSRIPDGVPDEVAGPIMCSASTMHRCLIDSGIKAGQWVVFPGGGGGVGIQGVMLAKYG